MQRREEALHLGQHALIPLSPRHPFSPSLSLAGLFFVINVGICIFNLLFARVGAVYVIFVVSVTVVALVTLSVIFWGGLDTLLFLFPAFARLVRIVFGKGI